MNDSQRDTSISLSAHAALFQYDNLIELFEDTCANYSDETAYVCGDENITFSQLELLSTQFAAYLQSLGLEKGCRIALMSTNTLSFVVAMWGIIRIGAIQVNVNPYYSPRELAHQLLDASPDTIIFADICTETVAQALRSANAKHLIKITDDALLSEEDNDVFAALPSFQGTKVSFKKAIQLGKNGQYKKPLLSHSDLVFLQYTGGTTGVSKGAELSHGNIVANRFQTYLMLSQWFQQSANKHVVLTVPPTYHIFSLSINIVLMFSLGAKNVLIPNPKDLLSITTAWSEHKPTFFSGVNTLFNALVNLAEFQSLDFSPLKITVGGGAAVQKQISHAWKSLTGVSLMEGYGLSETSPVLTLNTEENEQNNGGIGLPLPYTQIKIVNDDNLEVAKGSGGELCAKGPQVMKAYWNNPQSSAESFTPDGFFKTGDIAYQDENHFFHIIDRKKDMILVSGFNVYPNEIEAVVGQHQDVLESACIGVPDAKTGEAVQLFIVAKNSDLQESQLIAHCKAHLAAYKVPKSFIFLDALPKSNVGKILRKELRKPSAIS